MNNIRLLTVSPTILPEITGNSIDYSRISNNVKNFIEALHVIKSDDISIENVQSFSPTIIHIYNAYKSHKVIPIAKQLNIPVVVTMSGTDYNKYLDNPHSRSLIMETVEYASQLICFNDFAHKEVQQKLPHVKDKVIIIKRDLPNIPTKKISLRQKFNIPQESILITLPAGIRSVKNNIFPLKPLSKLITEKKLPIQLLFIGPILEKSYFNEFKRELAKYHPFALYGEVLPYEFMGTVYEESDIILNVSHSEGVSNTLFEALQHNTLIVASDITGNKSIITHHYNGILYKANNSKSFTKELYTILTHKPLQEKILSNSKFFINNEINKEESINYLTLYKKYHK